MRHLNPCYMFQSVMDILIRQISFLWWHNWNPSDVMSFISFAFLFAVKHDCVFGDDLDIDEISFVSEVCSGLW